jgi:hypothetical protein
MPHHTLGMMDQIEENKSWFGFLKSWIGVLPHTGSRQAGGARKYRPVRIIRNTPVSRLAAVIVEA